MEQNLKELLLKDLCARLPYEVKIQVKEWTTLDTELKIGHINRLQNDDIELKSYLRPMSSMTNKETNIFNSDFGGIEDSYNSIEIKRIDWLNAHHFDYRNLIEKGLAIEASEGMYNL